MKLTQKELKWFARLEKCLAAAPESLRKKVSSYTIGDDDIVIFDVKRADTWEDDNLDRNTHTRDRCHIVDASSSRLYKLNLPFVVESTAG